MTCESTSRVGYWELSELYLQCYNTAITGKIIYLWQSSSHPNKIAKNFFEISKFSFFMYYLSISVFVSCTSCAFQNIWRGPRICIKQNKFAHLRWKILNFESECRQGHKNCSYAKIGYANFSCDSSIYKMAWD